MKTREEGQLKKGIQEYQVSLVIDNSLNTERRKQKLNKLIQEAISV